MVNDKKTNLLGSLTGTVQGKPQKELVAEIRNSGSILDKVELFTNRQEINVLKARVKAEPAVRQERVDEIREAIKNEAYYIKAELVARSILKSHLLDELLR
jgi:flagellar biosynthesis anti-sigma factor FlgM